MTGASHGTQPDSMHVQCTRLHPKQDAAELHALGSMTNLHIHPHASACMHARDCWLCQPCMLAQ